MVKDNRTGLERSDPEKVLNGELEPFLEEALHKL
jgi:Protein chain release factor B